MYRNAQASNLANSREYFCGSSAAGGVWPSSAFTACLAPNKTAHGSIWFAHQVSCTEYIFKSGSIEGGAWPRHASNSCCQKGVVNPTATSTHWSNAAIYYLGLGEVNASIAEQYLEKAVVSKEVSRRLSLEDVGAYKAFVAAHPKQIIIP